MDGNTEIRGWRRGSGSGERNEGMAERRTKRRPSWSEEMTEEVPGLRLMLSDIDNWVPGSQSKKNQSALVNFDSLHGTDISERHHHNSPYAPVAGAPNLRPKIGECIGRMWHGNKSLSPYLSSSHGNSHSLLEWRRAHRLAKSFENTLSYLRRFHPL